MWERPRECEERVQCAAASERSRRKRDNKSEPSVLQILPTFLSYCQVSKTFLDQWMLSMYASL